MSTKEMDKSMEQLEAETEDELQSMIRELNEASLDEESAPKPAQNEPQVDEQSAPKDLEDFHIKAEEASMEETLSELKEEGPPANPSLLDGIHETSQAKISSANKVVPLKGSRHSEEQAEDGALSLTLSGQITLKLKYAFGGQEVSLSFVNSYLKVELSDGTEFKIPVRHTRTKVA